jgi:F-type H+-transporting ATPase subunit delta
VAEGPGIVYGEALFEVASDAGRVEQVHRDLRALAEALSSNHDLVRVLFNPAFPEQAKRQILARLSDGGDPLVQNALQVLIDHGRLNELPAMIEGFEARHAELEKRLEVELTTAIPIDEGQAERLRKQLSEGSGQTVSLTRRVDPGILGGVVLRARDLLIDASVRGRLEALRLTLRKARLSGPAAPEGHQP